MKKIFTLLIIAVFCFGCSSDDDGTDPDPNNPNTNPEVPATESLKGQIFSGYFSTYDDGDAPAYDMYRIYSFISDKEVIEYVTKNSANGDTIAEYKGSYAYAHPDLQLTIIRVGDIENIHKATMNDAKNEFSYPISGSNLIFKKK
jgi:hypothetical protein